MWSGGDSFLLVRSVCASVMAPAYCSPILLTLTNHLYNCTETCSIANNECRDHNRSKYTVIRTFGSVVLVCAPIDVQLGLGVSELKEEGGV